MELHVVTFERLEREFELGPIRAIEVDHLRSRLAVVCDGPPSSEKIEGAMMRQVGFHDSDRSEVQREH